MALYININGTPIPQMGRLGTTCICSGDCTTIYTEHMQGRECPPLQDYIIVLILLEMGVGSLRQSQKPSADRVSV